MDDLTGQSPNTPPIGNPAQSDQTASRQSPWLKVMVFCATLMAVVWAYVNCGDAVSLENLAAHETTLRGYQDTWFIIGAAFLLYAMVTAVSLPGAAVTMTLVYGWYFGFVKAVVIVSFASTTGATLAFLLSRYLFRDAIQTRFGERLAAFNDKLKKEGALYLFTLRLIPLVPFFVINLVMGLTPIKTWTFWWVSQLGMLAGTAVYTYVGWSMPSLTELAEKGPSGIFTVNIAIAFALLGVFPIAVKKLLPIQNLLQAFK